MFQLSSLVLVVVLVDLSRLSSFVLAFVLFLLFVSFLFHGYNFKVHLAATTTFATDISSHSSYRHIHLENGR